jgi:hypothetical protein
LESGTHVKKGESAAVIVFCTKFTIAADPDE